jgi:hypothetical protein
MKHLKTDGGMMLLEQSLCDHPEELEDAGLFRFPAGK